jgi:uncharacterized damage-inducible protein DinB
MTHMTPDLAATCRQHLDFMKWADERLLAAVAEHLPTQTVILQHIYLAEAVWFGRVQGQENLVIGDLKAPSDIAALQEAWPQMHRDWLAWAAALTDWDTIIPHRNPKGDLFHMPAWQIVLHLANHGSFHRGQVAALIRAAGFAPPASDLVIYYRGLGIA